jgi:hypothetical protein
MAILFNVMIGVIEISGTGVLPANVRPVSFMTFFRDSAGNRLTKTSVNPSDGTGTFQPAPANQIRR